jgi:hypothetical protein
VSRDGVRPRASVPASSPLPASSPVAGPSPALVVLLTAVLAALLLVACGSTASSASSDGSEPSVGGPAATDGRGTAGPASSLGAPPSPTPPDDATPIAIDPTLLELLPASIAAIPVVEDLDVAAEALSDPAISRIATGIDAAVAVDTGTSNLVTAWVVRLREGAFGEELYRQWRDSYDEGACAAGGGILGRAQAELGGRNTYVTSCVTAVRTYHVWLEEEDVLISASSIGEGRFGEQLLSTLEVPE